MGAGKSTIGRCLANDLQRPFVDSDLLVEVHHGSSPAELELREGLARLHDAELETMRRVLVTRDSVVFAAAASVVDRVSADELQGAFAVWLDASPEILAARIAGDHDRPALGSDPRAALRRQAEARRPVARDLADLWIDVEQGDPKEISFRIAEACRASDV
jgi:shikimate kinase